MDAPDWLPHHRRSLPCSAVPSMHRTVRDASCAPNRRRAHLESLIFPLDEISSFKGGTQLSIEAISLLQNFLEAFAGAHARRFPLIALRFQRFQFLQLLSTQRLLQAVQHRTIFWTRQTAAWLTPCSESRSAFTSLRSVSRSERRCTSERHSTSITFCIASFAAQACHTREFYTVTSSEAQRKKRIS